MVDIRNESGDKSMKLRLPIHLFSPDQLERRVNYLMLIIQSGSCALGYFEDEINLEHKTFSAYMVRKKQGKSQIKYLKTKGKSRAGSRVRLAETAAFFDRINERLQMYFDHHTIDRIAFSCSKILLPYFFNAKVDPPFSKADPRILKIPKHIHTPNHSEMMRVQKFMLMGELSYDESLREQVDQWIS